MNRSVKNNCIINQLSKLLNKKSSDPNFKIYYLNYKFLNLELIRLFCYRLLVASHEYILVLL